MNRSRLFAAVLLAGTGLSSVPALAQSEPVPSGQDVTEPADIEDEEVEISAPGSTGNEIVVTGRFIPQPVRSNSQVVNVISAEDIARTGDGDIAGALQRVTGLSLANNGFVYVRGLGDRYSLALLNGLPLPSPEPLRRVVPLDVFPTSVVSSAVVQKSYSVNYPGEYGGGAINLTTAALPDESFISVGFGLSGDTETTSQLGYTYYGSETDIIGYDDGTRDLPTALLNNGGQLVSANVLENQDTLILQRNRDIPANASASLSAGYSTFFGDTEFGVTANAGFSNGWKTRGATQETATGGSLTNSSYGVRTENRIQANGLLALGLDLPQGHKLRFTNVYIHDTSKIARVRGIYESIQTPFEDLDPDQFTQPYDSLRYESSFIERQLFTSQLVGEFVFGALEVEMRGSYSRSDRESPYERLTQYNFDGTVGGYEIQLAQPSGVTFSNLDEDVWAGGIDFAYDLSDVLINGTISAGYSYTDTVRDFQSLEFLYDDGGTQIGQGLEYLPAYLILTPALIEFEDINLRQVNRSFGFAQYRGDLTVHGAYVRADLEVASGVRFEAGVRYEDGKQFLTLPDIYENNPAGAGIDAVIAKENSYWLPAATLTWNFAPDFQLRVHGSKTIARPQFRELGTVEVLDVESDRLLFGNPFLTDSELYNAEARVEFYPGRGERVSVAGFYKRLENPIESLATVDSAASLLITNVNAPAANLYGVEAEAVKFIGLEGLGQAFEAYRLLVSANYTYSKSEIKVADGDTATLFTNSVNTPLVVPATQVFADGSPLTGQSEHLANLQLGIENIDKLSQLTLLLAYASERVTSRGALFGTSVDPDIVEDPGLTVDIVARQGINIGNMPELELKIEARNIFGRDNFETQDFGTGVARINNYDVGTSFSASISAKF